MFMIFGRLAVILVLLAAPFGAGAEERITVAFPGPRNISYLPMDLIPAIGADKAEGVKLVISYTGGGGVALQELMQRNADFAVAGMPAAMSLRLKNPGVMVIGAVDDLPLFVLMVRKDLAGIVKSPADLAGRAVGVNTSSLSSKTTSQQLAELVLANSGIAPDRVRMMAAGQSWEEQSSLIISGTLDAIMGDEPFASRLLASNHVFFLTNLADPQAARSIPGSGFLHAAIETRAEIIATEPAKVATMMRMVKRSLEWIATHTPDQVIRVLGIAETEEGRHLAAALARYKRLYSPDGKLSESQMDETDKFFRATSGTDPRMAGFRIRDMINTTWSGAKP